MSREALLEMDDIEYQLGTEDRGQPSSLDLDADFSTLLEPPLVPFNAKKQKPVPKGTKALSSQELDQASQQTAFVVIPLKRTFGFEDN